MQWPSGLQVLQSDLRKERGFVTLDWKIGQRRNSIFSPFHLSLSTFPHLWSYLKCLITERKGKSRRFPDLVFPFLRPPFRNEHQVIFVMIRLTTQPGNWLDKEYLCKQLDKLLECTVRFSWNRCWRQKTSLRQSTWFTILNVPTRSWKHSQGLTSEVNAEVIIE